YLERKWGVYFAKGGTNALVSGLVKVFTDIGGEIRFNAEIEEIATADGKIKGVRTKGGALESFDLVVSNADVARTYVDLLAKEPRLDGQRKKMLSSSWSMSLFLIYFGTKKRYPHMAHHNVIFGSRYT